MPQAKLVSVVAGKVWDITEETNEAVQAGNVIQVLTGKVGKYLSNMQVTVNDAIIVPPEKIDSECAGILPESFYTYEELKKQWDELMEVLVPKHKELVRKFMENEKIWQFMQKQVNGLINFISYHRHFNN